MEVEVRQYVRPHGRIRPITIDMPKELESIIKQIHDSGFRLAAEVLRSANTDDVSFTIENDEMDLDIEIVPNGSGTREALERLIRRFPERVKEYSDG